MRTTKKVNTKSPVRRRALALNSGQPQGLDSGLRQVRGVERGLSNSAVEVKSEEPTQESEQGSEQGEKGDAGTKSALVADR